MPLNETPDEVIWPASTYIFIEKLGPFARTAPACWRELHGVLPQLLESHPLRTIASLYKIKPEMIYRAGFMTSGSPSALPSSVRSEAYRGGRYLRYTLHGSYSQLPEACGRVFELLKTRGIAVRDDFYIENYVNDPQKTSEDQLVTEILIPIP